MIELVKISDVTELSIDNLVLDKLGNVRRITYNDLHAFKNPNMGGNYGVYKLPLTAKYLEDFSFVRSNRIDRDGDDNFVWFNQFDIHELKENDFAFAVYVKGESMFKGGYGIDSVHRLQNLYKSMTTRTLYFKSNLNEQP